MASSTRKIVFIGVNSSYSHTMLSYGYVRAGNESFCPDCTWEYLETTINDDELTFSLEIAALEPDFVLGTAYLFNRDFLLRAAMRIKALLPSVAIFLGGPEFLGNNETFLRRFPAVDGVIRGDESSLYRILNGAPAAPGFCRIGDRGDYEDGGIAELPAGASIPSPYLAGYFVRGKPFYQIETSRGCNGRCTFCTSSCRNNIRYFPPERVRAELQALAAAGAQEIRVLDRTFNEPPERAITLLAMFRDEFPGLRFHLEINPARLTPELLAELQSFPPGQLHVEAGVQTFNGNCLRLVRRPATAAKTAAGLRQLLGCGNFAVHSDLIAGLPGQASADVVTDLTRLIELGPEEIQLENLKVLPGTPLAENPPSDLRRNPGPPYEVLQTSGFSPAELQAARQLSKIIDHYYNQPELRRLFAWAWLTRPAFRTGFPAFLIHAGNPMIKVSPQQRLERLAEFAASADLPLLAELTRFVWLINGLPPEKYGLVLHKTVRGEIVPATAAILNRTDNDNELKRYFIAEFSVDAAALLHSSTPAWRQTPHRYLFYPLHGQRLGRLVLLKYDAAASENHKENPYL